MVNRLRFDHLEDVRIFDLRWSLTDPQHGSRERSTFRSVEPLARTVVS